MKIRRLLLLLLAALALPAAGQDTKPLALHPDNPHYFLFRGKPAVLVGSTEHYGAVMNLDFDYVPYLDELARHGLNHTRTFSGTYREVPGSFGITDNTLSPTNYLGPWARTDTPGGLDSGDKFDLSKYDEKYFARLKDFVAQASKRGVVVEYVLFCTFYNDDLWKIAPMNPSNNVNDTGDVPRRESHTLKHPKLLALQDALVKKVLTELNGFDNVYFEICNEPYFEGVADDWQAHVAQVIVETEKTLPNRHLIAHNIANDKKKVEKLTTGVSILNFHYATPPDTVEMNYAHNVPISDDETGFKGKDDVFYRTEGWDFFVAGGAAYNNLDYSFTAKTPAGTLRNFKSPGGGGEDLRRSLGALRKFMEGFDLPRMRPTNGVVTFGRVTAVLNPPAKNEAARAAPVTVRVLADPGRAYALYVRGGTSIGFSLDLPKGLYRTEWIDTKTGDAVKTELIDHSGGGERAMMSPAYTDDIALRIVKAD